MMVYSSIWARWPSWGSLQFDVGSWVCWLLGMACRGALASVGVAMVADGRRRTSDRLSLSGSALSPSGPAAPAGVQTSVVPCRGPWSWWWRSSSRHVLACMGVLGRHACTAIVKYTRAPQRPTAAERQCRAPPAPVPVCGMQLSSCLSGLSACYLGMVLAFNYRSIMVTLSNRNKQDSRSCEALSASNRLGPVAPCSNSLNTPVSCLVPRGPLPLPCLPVVVAFALLALALCCTMWLLRVLDGP
jgi:hypothetical protein